MHGFFHIAKPVQGVSEDHISVEGFSDPAILQGQCVHSDKLKRGQANLLHVLRTFEQQLAQMQVPIMKQYIFSVYWMASTLSTASLVGFTTPKNEAELLFTILAMLTTLTFYAYGVFCPSQL